MKGGQNSAESDTPKKNIQSHVKKIIALMCDKSTVIAVQLLELAQRCLQYLLLQCCLVESNIFCNNIEPWTCLNLLSRIMLKPYHKTGSAAFICFDAGKLYINPIDLRQVIQNLAEFAKSISPKDIEIWRMSQTMRLTSDIFSHERLMWKICMLKTRETA